MTEQTSSGAEVPPITLPEDESTEVGHVEEDTAGSQQTPDEVTPPVTAGETAPEEASDEEATHEAAAPEAPAEVAGPEPAAPEEATEAAPQVEVEAPALQTEAATEPEAEAPDEEAPAEPESGTPAEPETEAPAEPTPAEPEAATEPEDEAPAEVAPAEPETQAPAEPEAEAPAEVAPAEPETEAPAEAATETATEAPDGPAPAPRPGPPIPSPAMLAARKPAVHPVAPAVAPVAARSESAKHGRVGDDGTVYVITGDTERAVGSYPEATADEALQYFARKYDELHAAAALLSQRVAQTDLSAHDARESLKSLRAQIGEANVVGDLAALETEVDSIAAAVKAKQQVETEHRSAAKAEATTAREALVTEAEKLAATDPTKVQWKQASTTMRDMVSQWQTLQKAGPRLDKDVENTLWQRLRAARSTFDKNRKTFFSHLDEEHADAKHAKERLVAEAEKLATSKDWGPTAGSFKALMQQWRNAGRASRADDDALWARFKAAQDSFFAAKDEVVAAENAEFEENLKVKEALLVDAEALLPVDSSNVEKVKASLRTIQDKWDAAGKVPREAIGRVEGRMRKVEQAVRDVEDKRWNSSNPELSARAQSMVAMFERAVQGAEQDLEAAKAGGDERKIRRAQETFDSQQALLESARAGLAEFGS